ncbi:efflux RND transporter periplasmic adaptor subunit [Gemmobacter sp.]|uniref:efflux RND transporter periplasmic adaptor subunit n=1 Tax=Gemmobacter sp. TaxID=1898957 RepID=UPI002AFEFACF|nr:HlyD family efflux transporter periplasmic adaptor subunit [Gemmobacter sp.]
MRLVMRSMTAIVLLAVTLAVLALAGHVVHRGLQARWADKVVPRAANERIYAAPVLAVVPGRIVPAMEVFGEVRSRRMLEVRAPRAGRIVWLAEGFEDGAAVAAGDVLLRLDPSDAQAALNLARADRIQAEADARDAARGRDLARDELASAQGQADLRRAAADRQRTLRERGVGSDAAVETAELAVQQAEQAVLSRRQALVGAEAQVDQAAVALGRLDITIAEAERALAETEVVAGFAGRLSDVAVVQGGLVGQNEKLAQIVDPDALEVAARISTAQHARLIGPDGALRPVAVQAELDLPGAQIMATGTLARSGAVVGEGQAGRVIYATLAPAPGLRPGDFVTLRIPEPALDDVIALPATALGNDGTVLALGPDDRLEAVPVVLERRQGDQVILRSPALDGREVVTERTPLLGAGVRVRPIRQGEQPAVQAPVAEMVDLTPERRAALIALVEGNRRMPAEARARILAQLEQDRVPAQIVRRLESRSGG